MDISQLPKGALPDPIDERDFQASDIMGTPIIDWSKEFRLPEPPNEDQGSSDSCVSQAWSYYHWQLHNKDFSRRDLFARIALDYGAVIRDGGKEIKTNGQATRDEVSDPKPETPQNMRNKAGVTAAAEASDKELDYRVLPNQSIDGVAWGIQNNKGVVFGVTGSNPGWQDLANPRPPAPGEETWGHALYAFGFHMHDGQKCIIAKSSWCNSGITEHHIRENYFMVFPSAVFNAWTLIPKGQSMELIRDNGTVYLVAGDKQKVKTGIADQTVESGIFGDQPIVDGDTSAIPETHTIAQGFIINKK